MRFSFSSILLLTATASATIIARDASTVSSALTEAVKALTDVSTQLSSFNGDILPGLGILMRSEDAVKNFDKAIGAATAKFSAQESTQLSTLLKDQVAPAEEKNIDLLVQKISIFHEASIHGVALGQLINLKAQTKTLFSTIGKQMTDGGSSLQSLSKTLTDKAEAAIVEYENLRSAAKTETAKEQ